MGYSLTLCTKWPFYLESSEIYKTLFEDLIQSQYFFFFFVGFGTRPELQYICSRIHNSRTNCNIFCFVRRLYLYPAIMRAENASLFMLTAKDGTNYDNIYFSIRAIQRCWDRVYLISSSLTCLDSTIAPSHQPSLITGYI